MTRRTFEFSKTLGLLAIILTSMFIYSTDVVVLFKNFDEVRTVISVLAITAYTIWFTFKMMIITDMNHSEANEEVNFNLNFYNKFMEHQKEKQNSKDAIKQLKENKQKLLLELSESNDDHRSEILIDKITLIDANLQ